MRFRLSFAGPFTIALLLAAISGAVLILGSRAGSQIIHETVEGGGQTIITTVSRSLFNNLYNLDIVSMGITLDQLVTEETIVYAGVRDVNGNLVSEAKADWNPQEEFLRELASQTFHRREPVSKKIDTRYLGLSAPLAAGPEQIGTLAIVFDQNSQQATLNSVQRNLLTILSVILFGAVLAGIILTRYAMRPFAILSSVAEKIGQGQLDTPVPVRGSQESAALGSAMERMRIELKEHYVSLEQKVADRTKELSKANRDMEQEILERWRAEEELKQTMSKLARSNKELEEFAHIASHDLQEPLRMVSSYTQLLQRRYKDKLDSDANEFIGYAVDGAKRMQTLINDLLVYSRITTQGHPLEATNFSDVFARAVTNLAGSIEDSGAIVTQDSLPTLPADASQLVSVFQNLIGNGIKYHGDHPPRMHVSAVEDGDEWLFSFKDNGIGIESEFAERIFQIFQRLHSKAKYAGTGIGLAICKKVIERHDGRIWVESEPQKGSTFYFTLPISNQEEDHGGLGYRESQTNRDLVGGRQSG